MFYQINMSSSTDSHKQDDQTNELMIQELRDLIEKSKTEEILKKISEGIDIDDLLPIACNLKNLEMVKFLVSKGANVKAYNKLYNLNQFPLIIACENGDLDIVKYLVEQGCNIHENNEFALKIACEADQFEVIKYLIEKGANIHIHDKCNDSYLEEYPFNCVFLTGNLEMVKYLASKGANIHANNE